MILSVIINKGLIFISMKVTIRFALFDYKFKYNINMKI